MDCREVQGFIHAFLDGEFDEEERVVFSAHVRTCEGCRRRVEFEESFRHKMRQSLVEEQRAPAALRGRVRQALAREERPESWVIRGLRWMVPAAAAAALLIGTVLSRQQEPKPSANLAESSIQWHRRTNLPLDVKASSPEAVKGFFSDKVPFAVHLPAFKRKRVQLVGGRLANLREHEAAYLVYRVDGRRVSVFIFDKSALPRDRHVHWQRLRGYNVAMFSSRGTGYAVASDLDPEQMVRLISW